MVTCCQCEGIERQFGRKHAEKELRRFRRSGPIPTTRALIDALRARGINGASVLDVGGGIGALHHVLLDAGGSHAVHIDVSPDYLELSREESTRLGHDDRVSFVRGDFVRLAPGMPEADVVTLDRVICCYPDMEQLVSASARKARRLYGAVYPREAWWVRAALSLTNGLNRLRRTAFRVFLHPPAAIEGVLRGCGLEPRTVERTFFWEIAVYARPGA
jgi:magnesium-protoporphyrin O-methyltransferase